MRPEGRAGITAPQKLVGLKRRRRLKAWNRRWLMLDDWAVQTQRIIRIAQSVHPGCTVYFGTAYKPGALSLRITSSKSEILCDLLEPTAVSEIVGMNDDAIRTRIINGSHKARRPSYKIALEKLIEGSPHPNLIRAIATDSESTFTAEKWLTLSEVRGLLKYALKDTRRVDDCLESLRENQLIDIDGLFAEGELIQFGFKPDDFVLS
jgi:hypothetical protein